MVMVMVITTVMFRFGEVHLVVKKSTGQHFAAKTIKARCLSSIHCPMSQSLKMPQFEHFDCHPERSIVRERKKMHNYNSCSDEPVRGRELRRRFRFFR